MASAANRADDSPPGSTSPAGGHKREGLALLLGEQSQAGMRIGYPSTEAAGGDNTSAASVLRHVLDMGPSPQGDSADFIEQPDTPDDIACTDGSINFPVVAVAIDKHLESLDSGIDEKIPTSPGPQASGEGDEASDAVELTGRIGTKVVRMDKETAAGSMNFSEDHLGIESLSNFSSARATVCVYKGRWMYEVTIGTGGIQQLGWATMWCPFTNEEGVGDAVDSYAYDGKRRKKWNVDCTQYGENWSAGDVIGCLIDLDKGEMSFSRNGVELGTAFSNVKRFAAGMAYFPALSLSQGERCELNFGGRPFAYPRADYSPLQTPPAAKDLTTARYLLGCLSRFARATCSADKGTEPSRDIAMASGKYQAQIAKFDEDDSALLAGLIATRLGPLLRKEYITVDALIPTLLEAHRKEEPHHASELLRMMGLLEAGLDPTEMEAASQHLMRALARQSRTSLFSPEEFPCTASYPYLALAQCLLHNVPTVRKAWLAMPDMWLVLEGLLTRKQPTTKDLKALLPSVWWQSKYADDEICSEERMKSMKSAMQLAVIKLEEQQYQLCTLLLKLSDRDVRGKLNVPAGVEQQAAQLPCTSALSYFLRYLAVKNKGATRNILPPGLSDNSVLLSVYFSLLRMMHPHLQAAPFAESGLASFPAHTLFLSVGSDPAANLYSDLPRLGGTIGHLIKETPVPEEELTPITVPSEGLRQQPLEQCSVVLDPMEVPYLIDSLMMLYHIGMAPSFKAYSYQQQTQLHSIQQLEDAERRLQRSSASPNDQWVRHLKEAKGVFREDVMESVRQTTWFEVMLFSTPKREAIFQACLHVVRLLLICSERQALFSYVPEFYLESLVEAFHALRRNSTTNLFRVADGGLEEVLTFLVTHFSDKRVVNPDLRDVLLQSISMLLQYKEYVGAFEANETAREKLINNLMSSFDGRFWITISSILLRLISGRGFGQANSKSAEIASPLYQRLLRDACLKNPDTFNSFLNRLFNTLNWTVTEFTVACKELRDISRNRGRRVPDLQQHQRKCTVMFELTCNLNRILEFLSLELPAVFLRGSSMNVTRLVELIGFVLSHTTAGPDANLLDATVKVSPSTLEKISRPVILAPIVGIIANLHAAGSTDEGRLKMDEMVMAHSGTNSIFPAGASGQSQLVESVAKGGQSCSVKAFQFLLEVKWREAFPEDTSVTSTMQTLKLFTEQLEEVVRREEDGGDHTDDAPDEFLDPIMANVMLDPVLLPDSCITVDRSTIERHLLSQQTDPFNRSHLTVDMLKPDLELKKRIDAWLKAHNMAR